MNKYFNSLRILRNLGNEQTISHLFDYFIDDSPSAYNDFVSAVYAAGAEENLSEYISNLILKDENAFSVQCAVKGNSSEYTGKAFISDLKLIFNLVNRIGEQNDFAIGKPLPIFSETDDKKLLKQITAFYAENGYGIFLNNKAFKFDGEKLTPVTYVSDIRLGQLKDYEAEKQAIADNICDFLNGLPFSHMLLYGDRGTGKSSTVHAMMNEYAQKGLKLIELSKENLPYVDNVKQLVAPLPIKFIIFIDDLSLNGEDEIISTLKASVEGSISAGSNAMIVATSNRRHIVKENFSDRENSVHPADSLEEELSLSDRFGLTVMFSSTDKNSYLSIVRQLAADAGLNTPAQTLESLAERWALIKGGRSPRRAKQFVEFAYSCERSGREIKI